MKLTSFPPIIPDNPRILILGSMPGEESLRKQQYYGHPRNAFWFIMGKLFQAGPELSYDERVSRLKECGVAVWDVLKHCKRQGSLDSSIQKDSEEPNDLIGLLSQYQDITHVFFNGQKAVSAFNKHVKPNLSPELLDRLMFMILPSTSPANARMTVTTKLDVWRQQLQT